MGFLNPEQTFIINVEGKDLPFRPKGYTRVSLDGPPVNGNIASTHKADTIIKLMKFVSDSRPEIKHLIVDDK
jgi:hypothetical protein